MTIDFQNIGLPDETDSTGVSPATAIAFTEGPAAAVDEFISRQGLGEPFICRKEKVHKPVSHKLVLDPKSSLKLLVNS